LLSLLNQRRGLTGYHHTLSQGEIEAALTDSDSPASTLPVQTPETVLTLCLVNVRQIAGLMGDYSPCLKTKS